ncbi:GNAT family N-acetyltransferase [Fusibacter sp. A1]|nr:GNAT family N-acetyltransferase [Fusibacter sp. A1]
MEVGMYHLVTKEEYGDLAKFLYGSPELNVNFTSLLITHGFLNQSITTWVRSAGGRLTGACSIYEGVAYVFEREGMDHDPLLSLLIGRKLRAITGPCHLITGLAEKMEHQRVWITHLMRLDHLNELGAVDSCPIQPLQLEDIAGKILVQNDAFELKIDPEDEKQRMLFDLKLLKGYVAKMDGKVVAAGEWTSSHPIYGTLVGIATLPEYRRNHCAQAISVQLCKDIISAGKTPVLRYDNPAAGRLYEKIGFVFVADYAVMFFDE